MRRRPSLFHCFSHSNMALIDNKVRQLIRTPDHAPRVAERGGKIRQIYPPPPHDDFVERFSEHYISFS